MKVAKKFVTVFLALVLLSLTQGQGQSSCKLLKAKHRVLRHKESNASALGNSTTCLGWKLDYRCSGLCDSKSTVSVKDRAFHWKQECECCQPTSRKGVLYHYDEFCEDGSQRSVKMPYVVPESCHCTDC